MTEQAMLPFRWQGCIVSESILILKTPDHYYFFHINVLLELFQSPVCNILSVKGAFKCYFLKFDIKLVEGIEVQDLHSRGPSIPNRCFSHATSGLTPGTLPSTSDSQ